MQPPVSDHPNSVCSTCGQPLPAGAPGGLCPACLLRQGALPDSSAGTARPRFVPPPLAQIAALFPQFEIQRLIGSGGMGAVYLARQPALDRWVALKLLPAETEENTGFSERFQREARALARLSHPHIVSVHEFGQADGFHYFVMEYVDGATLRQLLQSGRLSSREALQIVPQICDALQYAHDEGVVHRDIKPENVLVDRKGRVKIADFGLAKIAGGDPAAVRLTGEGQVMGTPHYMAPEQLEHPLAVDHRADIFSLGVVFYEMLTGDLPLGKFAPPSRKVSVDVRLDEIVLRALENDPERRYQQASEVKQRVATVVAQPAAEGASVRPSTDPSPVAQRAPRLNWMRILAGIGMGLGAAMVLSVVMYFVGRSVPQPPDPANRVVPAQPSATTVPSENPPPAPLVPSEPTPIQEVDPVVSAAQLTEAPVLRYVAWQDEFATNGAVAARRPDGQSVTNEAELRWITRLPPLQDRTGADEEPGKTGRVVHLWIVHPALDRASSLSLELLDGAGAAIALGARGGSIATFRELPDATEPSHCQIYTLRFGAGASWPKSVQVRFRYALGSPPNWTRVPADFDGSMSFMHGVLAGIGDAPNQRAFLAANLESSQKSGHQVLVRAVTKAGRELKPVGTQSSGLAGAAFTTERFEFETKLAQLDHFRVGSRPVRSMTWSNVVLRADSARITVDGLGTFATLESALAAAPTGATLRLPAGNWTESVFVGRSVTLEGDPAGGTQLRAVQEWREPTATERATVEERLRSARTETERQIIRQEATDALWRPAMRIRSAGSVRLSHLRLSGAGVPPQGGTLPLAVVEVADAEVSMRDCALVGSPGNGLLAGTGAVVRIERSLIAAAWNTGVQAGPGSNVEVLDSDVRNCHYAGIVARGAQLTVRGSRISGAAWHGLRYDDLSPTIVDNLIFANARSGIYASGRTRAIVRGNIFFENEMNGMSCWYANEDEISGNTFWKNRREALSVLGGSAPRIQRNIFQDHPIAIFQGSIGGQRADAPLGKPQLEANVFWQNGTNRVAPEALVEPGGAVLDPGLTDPAARNFVARQASEAGARQPAYFPSPHPLQPEEAAMIPDGPSRDSRSWKRLARP